MKAVDSENRESTIHLTKLSHRRTNITSLESTGIASTCRRCRLRLLAHPVGRCRRGGRGGRGGLVVKHLEVIVVCMSEELSANGALVTQHYAVIVSRPFLHVHIWKII